MRSLALILPALLALPLVAPLRVEAQLTTPTTGVGTQTTGVTGAGNAGRPIGIGIERVSYGPKGAEKKEIKSENVVFINRAQCDSYFEFEFTNLQPRAPELELWVTTDPNTDCSTAASRTALSGQTSNCWLVGRISDVQGKSVKFEAYGPAIFDNNREFSKSPMRDCSSEGASDRPYYLSFVSLSSPTPPDTNLTSPPAPTGTVYRVRFNLYTTIPSPPSGVEVGGGETAITAKWDVDARQRITYRAYYDIGSSDAECGSGALAPIAEGEPRAGDMVAVDDVTVFTSGSLNKPTSSLTNLEDKGLKYGSNVAVAVARVDPAGNVGYLSPVQCAPFVETISAIDACGGSLDDCGLETCGLSPASRGSWFGLSLFVLSLAALIRRRTA